VAIRYRAADQTGYSELLKAGSVAPEAKQRPDARNSGGRSGQIDIVLVTAKSGRKKVANARPHLDGRALSAEGEPSTHRQHATKEFHRDQDQRRRR
jgi:hypothetical protein